MTHQPWPWRYRCPECNSTTIAAITSCSRPNGQAYRADGVGKQRASADASKRYFCHSCGERKQELLDMKEMKYASPAAFELE